MFDVSAYYHLAVSRFPEIADLPARIREEDGDSLYPLIWNILCPLALNVGVHGAQADRKRVFSLLDELLKTHPELSNEIGVGVVEVAPAGWFQVAADASGPWLRERLDEWESGWESRIGPAPRVADPYGVEDRVANHEQGAWIPGPTSH